MNQAHKLRIGELSYRVRVRPELLRAWERRYGLLQPARSERGFRLYSEADERRVRLMQHELESGLSAAEAAQEVARLERERDAADRALATPLELAGELRAALEAFDEAAAHEVLDRLFGIYGLERAIREALMPYLRGVGERWQRGQEGIAHQRFASGLLEGRLLALARGWNKGPGRRAVLACPSGEQHTIPLVCFGLVLRSRGWRNTYLGADTPPSSLHMAANTVDAHVIVLSAVSGDRFEPIARDLKGLARKRPLALAGGGATPALAADLGAECLNDDPASAAEAFSRSFVRGGGKGRAGVRLTSSGPARPHADR